MAKYATVTDDDLRRLEGKLQELRDMDSRELPRELTANFVARTLAVRASTVRQWVRLARPVSRRNEHAAAFLDVYDQIGAELAKPIMGAVFATALTANGRDALRAQLYLLPRVDPATHSDVEEQHSDDDELNIANQPQEVCEQITSEELERLDELVAIREQAQREAESILLRAQQRALKAKIDQYRTH